MRVLFLNRHDVMDDSKHPVGGLVEVFRSLSVALRECGVTTCVYSEDTTRGRTLQAPHLTAAGIPCYAGPFPKPRRFHLPGTFQPLVTLCRQEKIDLIHAHGLYRNGWIALQIQQRLNIPYIITSHSDVFSVRRGQRKTILARYRRILHHAAGVTHLTPHMMQLAAHILDTQHKNILIPNGIHVSGELAQASEKAEKAEKNFLLTLGRLVPEKGFHLLIAAYAALRRQGHTQPALVIAGKGPTETALHEQACQLGLTVCTNLPAASDFPPDCVFFPGYIQGDTKQYLLNHCLAVLFPTQPTLWDEPFGLIQLEAMAAGKALIASDMAAVRYMETMGLQAIRVKADDPTAWATAISSLISDPEKRHAMGRQNGTAVSAFDWRVIARQYADFYRKIAHE